MNLVYPSTVCISLFLQDSREAGTYLQWSLDES